MRIDPLAVALVALAVAAPHARAAGPIALEFGFPPPPTAYGRVTFAHGVVAGALARIEPLTELENGA